MTCSLIVDDMIVQIAEELNAHITYRLNLILAVAERAGVSCVGEGPSSSSSVPKTEDWLTLSFGRFYPGFYIKEIFDT